MPNLVSAQGSDYDMKVDHRMATNHARMRQLSFAPPVKLDWHVSC
jgi:hypothetical protein